MKKAYIEPQLKCVKINAVNLLTLSSGDGKLSVGISNEGATGDAEGREFDFTEE